MAILLGLCVARCFWRAGSPRTQMPFIPPRARLAVLNVPGKWQTGIAGAPHVSVQGKCRPRWCVFSSLVPFHLGSIMGLNITIFKNQNKTQNKTENKSLSPFGITNHLLPCTSQPSIFSQTPSSQKSYLPSLPWASYPVPCFFFHHTFDLLTYHQCPQHMLAPPFWVLVNPTQRAWLNW